MNTMKDGRRGAIALAMAIAIGGCAAQQAPALRVQDCGIVAISSPPKYACNGKVYTAFQLTQMRAEQEKKHQSGQ